MGAVAITVFSLDFILKYYLKTHLLGSSIPVIENVFHITVISNKGAAFGLFRDHSGFILYTSVILVFFLVYMVARNERKSLSEKIIFGLIIGGALSNMYDRVVYKGVIDYLDFRIWPVFNLSDACITLGVVFYLLKSLFPRYARTTKE